MDCFFFFSLCSENNLKEREKHSYIMLLQSIHCINEEEKTLQDINIGVPSSVNKYFFCISDKHIDYIVLCNTT